MMFGLSLEAFTALHVVISLIGILAGVVFFIALLQGKWRSTWLGLFLIFTILTSVTGFLFPPKPIGPPFIFGVISLAALATSLFALYPKQHRGGWRIIALGSALLAQYLNMVVLVVQSFQKIPFFNVLAPDGGGPVFLGTHVALLFATFYVGWKTLRRIA
jgi:hypothetical protein